MRTTTMLLALLALGCSGRSETPSLEPEPPSEPDPEPAPEATPAAAVETPPSYALEEGPWRDNPVEGHLRVRTVRRPDRDISWEEVEHPEASVSARLAEAAAQLAWQAANQNHLMRGCTATLAHTSVVSFGCVATELGRSGRYAVHRDLHVGVVGDRLYPFEVDDVLGRRFNPRRLARAGCRAALAERRREDETIEAECDPERASLGLGPDGVVVRFPVSLTPDTLDVVVAFDARRAYRDGGPLAALRGDGEPGAPSLDGVPDGERAWAVSATGSPASVIGRVSELDDAQRDAVRVQVFGGDLVRLVVPGGDEAREIATAIAGRLSGQVESVQFASPWPSEVTRSRAGAAATLSPPRSYDGVMLPAGTLAWTADLTPPLSSLGARVHALASGLVGTVPHATYQAHEGCAPAPPTELREPLTALTSVSIDGQRHDAAMFVERGDSVHVIVHRLEDACRLGAKVFETRANGHLADLRLTATEADGGTSIVVLGVRRGGGEASYTAHVIGTDAPAWSATRPENVNASEFLRLGETVVEGYFPITVDARPQDETGARPPIEQTPVTRLRWTGSALESSTEGG